MLTVSYQKHVVSYTMLGPGCLLIEMIKALGLNQPISEFF